MDTNIGFSIVSELVDNDPAKQMSLAAKYRKLLSDRAAKRTAADIARRNRLRIQAEEKAKAAAVAQKGT